MTIRRAKLTTHAQASLNELLPCLGRWRRCPFWRSFPTGTRRGRDHHAGWTEWPLPPPHVLPPRLLRSHRRDSAARYVALRDHPALPRAASPASWALRRAGRALGVVRCGGGSGRCSIQAWTNSSPIDLAVRAGPGRSPARLLDRRDCAGRAQAISSSAVDQPDRRTAGSSPDLVRQYRRIRRRRAASFGVAIWARILPCGQMAMAIVLHHVQP